MATREIEVEEEVEFDLERDSRASVLRSQDRTARSAGPTPRLAQRPADLPLESASGTPTPATRPQPLPQTAEPRALPTVDEGASLLPSGGASSETRRSVVSNFNEPASLPQPAAESELAVQPTSAQTSPTSGGVWRANLMVR